jgi:hypothetical protein
MRWYLVYRDFRTGSAICRVPALDHARRRPSRPPPQKSAPWPTEKIDTTW